MAEKTIQQQAIREHVAYFKVLESMRKTLSRFRARRTGTALTLPGLPGCWVR
ncbi:hypothetical protein [Streptomyces sp. NPDC005181]|uniref:hypothetical protein n=1 Tax=Streptomyces sp. NPDC005181 TaxID=3156869 RepID=UPI0033B37509